MKTNRLEAFSDGVLAIIITIMVLEMEVPEGIELSALQPLIPVFLSYLLSFVYVGIYWNNHHHLLHAAERVNSKILWANMHLLFWLSLIPFATAWMGENHFETYPGALYGVVLLMCAFAYWLLQTAILNESGKDSVISKAIGSDLKGKASLLAYFLAIPLNFYSVILAGCIYVLVALIWLIPDKRIEKNIKLKTN